MSAIKPLKAILPNKNFAEKIVSYPYDVLSQSEIYALTENNSKSFLRITRSECEFRNDENPYQKKMYERAEENLNLFLDNKWIFQSPKEAFYIYRISANGKTQTGITGLFSCEEYQNNLVLKHEATRTEKELDRTDHIRTTKSQTGQVYLTHNKKDLCKDIINHTIKNNQPKYDFIDYENVKHSLWEIEKEFNVSLIKEFLEVPQMFIVDGHHRAAAALNNNCKYFIATAFPYNELTTGCCNRLLSSDCKMKNSEFIERLKKYFIVKKISLNSEETLKTYFNYQWFSLNLKEKKFNSTVEKIDSYIVQEKVFKNIFKIENPRTSSKIDYVRNTKGDLYLQNEIDSGKAFVAFSLVAPTVKDVINIALEGDVMPPKSTWFFPKLLDGIITYNFEN